MEKQKTLTLTLPFVDFKDTGKSTFERKSYEKKGAYFVRNRMGTHEIVVVSGEKDSDVWTNPIPEPVTEQFFIQGMEEEQADKFEEMNKRLDDTRNMVERNLDGKLESAGSLIAAMCEAVRHIRENTEQLLNMEEGRESQPKVSDRSNGGYVNEDVLLQIIKEVKK